MEGIELEGLDELGELDTEVMLFEFKHGINSYLARLGPQAPVHDLSEIIAFNERHAERVMPHFGQEYFYSAQEKGDLNERPYLDALARVKRMTGKDGIDAALARHRLDGLAARTIGPPWVIDLVNGDNRSSLRLDLGGLVRLPQHQRAGRLCRRAPAWAVAFRRRQ